MSNLSPDFIQPLEAFDLLLTLCLSHYYTNVTVFPITGFVVKRLLLDFLEK